MREKGSSIMQCYDAFDGRYYDLCPVSEHIRDTIKSAQAGTKREWGKFKEISQQRMSMIRITIFKVVYIS